MARNWRSVNPANYRKKENMAGALLEGFASVYVPTVLKQKELDDKRAYEEEKERKARAAAAAKAAKAQEAKDKKLAKNAKILAKQYSGSDNNGEALVFFTQQLQLTDGDVGDVMTLTERMIEDGRLKFVTKTESRPLQGPDVPSDFQTSLTVGDTTFDKTGSGTPLTVGKLDNIANNENNSDAVRDEASQMAEVFAPVSEEPNMDTPVEGIEITPFGQQDDKLDYTRLATLDDIEMYRLEIEGGDIKLSEEALAVIDAREKALKSGRTDDNIQKAFSDPDFTGGRLQVLGRTEQGKQSDEYLALLSLKEMHDGKAEKPYDAILDAQSIKDAADVRELQRIERIASELGATDTDLAAVRAEIAARSGEKTPIEYSSLTANNYEGKARELEDAGRADDAALVREFGKAQFAEKPLSIVELGGLNEVTLNALNSTVTDQEYKTRIQTVLSEKAAIKDRETAKDELTMRRELVGKDEKELQDIITSPDFSPELQASAQAILDSRTETFDLTKYDDVQTATLTTIINSDKTNPKLIPELQALVANRQQGTPKIMAGSETFVVKFLDEAGELQITTAKLTEDGRYVDLNNPTTTVEPADGQAVVNLDLQTDMYDDVIKINQSVIKPLREQRVAMLTTLQSAKKLDDLVNPQMGGDPTILTTVGGQLVPFMQRAGVEVATLVDLYNQQGFTRNQIDAAIDKRVSDYLANSRLGDTARKAALFQAEKIKLAFSFAASSLGQSNTGLSNKDFDNALRIIDTGSTYKSFSENIRSQAQAVVDKTQNMVTDFTEDDSVRLLRSVDQTGELFNGYSTAATEYATKRGLGDAVQWLSGSPTEKRTPTLEEFLKVAGPQNPNKSEAELTEYYNATYGGN